MSLILSDENNDVNQVKYLQMDYKSNDTTIVKAVSNKLFKNIESHRVGQTKLQITTFAVFSSKDSECCKFFVALKTPVSLRTKAVLELIKKEIREVELISCTRLNVEEFLTEFKECLKNKSLNLVEVPK